MTYVNNFFLKKVNLYHGIYKKSRAFEREDHSQRPWNFIL